MSKTNPQRKMSRLQLKKLKEDAKYNDQMRIERNSYLLETERLKDDIKQLETELYFCNRNNRIGEVVDERTRVETQKKVL